MRVDDEAAGTDVTGVTVIGGAGVDLFFVVSGFIMIHATAQPFDAGRFCGTG